MGFEKNVKAGKVEPSWNWAKKSTPVLLAVATLLFTVAYASPFWGRTDTDKPGVARDEFIGVWRYCAASYGGGYNCDDFIDLGSYGDWLKAVQSFSTLAFFSLLGTVGIYGAYVFASMESMAMFGCAMGSSLLTMVFEVITVGVFAGEYTEYFIMKEGSYTADSCKLAWAWYMAVFATALTFTAPVLILIDFLRNLIDDDLD